MKLELDLNEIELSLLIEALEDKAKENTVNRLHCNGIINHIKDVKNEKYNKKVLSK